MQLEIFDTKKNRIGQLKLPFQFDEEYRPDIIHRVVLAIQSHKRQAHAASPLAGKRSSAKLSRRRKDYRGSYGIGISRVPRKIISRSGTRMNWIGAFAPGTVGGRRAHPPKSEKILWKKVNDKERLKALRSAIAATALKDVVKERGHLAPQDYPFVLDDAFESISKTGIALESLMALGLENELDRVREKKVRPGKGKARGRKYKKKKGPLIVVSKKDKMNKAFQNIPGVDIVEVKSLNVELLAPGAKPGRLTLWTSGAISRLEKEKLFS